MNYNHYGHCTYLLTYHLILVVKYRRACITQEIAEEIQNTAAQILKQNRGKLIEFNTDKDHVHMIIETNPSQPIGKLVGVIKGISARHVRSKFKEYLKDYLWGDSFWSDSYFIASCGGVTVDTLKKYVENQGSLVAKRKRGRPRRDSSQP